MEEANNHKHNDYCQPLSPVARVSLHPEGYSVILCGMTTANPIDVAVMKAELATSVFATHPRFTSIPVRHPSTGCHHWIRSSSTDAINLDRHIIMVPPLVESLNAYLSELIAHPPFSTDKPLWEIHVLPPPNDNCAVFRIHHSLGDASCVMSLLQSFFRPSKPASSENKKAKTISRRRSTRSKMISMARTAWFTAVYGLRFLARVTCVADEETSLRPSKGQGHKVLEMHLPRKLTLLSLSLEDMKIVKNAVSPSATINDVLLGIISYGLSKYLHMRSEKELRKGLQLTGVAAVNLRQHSRVQEVADLMKKKEWGNKLSFILNPIQYREPKRKDGQEAVDDDPLQHLRAAKSMMDKKKKSFEAQLVSYGLRFSMALGCEKFAVFFEKGLLQNSTFGVSNVVGPSEVLTMVGNPVTSLRLTISSAPIPLLIHMLSYAGKAELQIQTLQDIIPDPHILANLFEEALRVMKLAATSGC